MSLEGAEPAVAVYDDSEGEESDDEDNWNEVEEEQEPTKCLFCDQISVAIENAIEHLKQQHHVSLNAIKTKFNLDQYSYIKMINYIRTHSITADGLQGINEVLWNDDKYMKPVEIDEWLMFDIEELKDGQTELPSDVQKIASLEHQLQEKDSHIEQLLEQINKMKTTFHAWVERTENGPIADPSAENGEEFGHPTHVANIPIQHDESYFTSYAHFGIHHEMLSDFVRTNSYKEAILQNKDSFQDKLVVDLGCGTSILSMFASQAGAKKVFAVDQSDIIYHAMDIVQRNKITNIEFIKGRIENTPLPIRDDEKVDIIVSEWMGFFLLFEGMLDSVIYTRDKYLKPGGLLLPNRCTINLCGLGDVERHNDYIGFWSNVYGFDMSIMQPKVLKEAIVEVCRSEHIITDSVVIADLSMQTVDYGYPNFEISFELKVSKSGKFTAFVGYFDTFFDLPNSVQFSTGPHSKPTHWQQVLFYLKNTVDVKEGDVISGQFQCNRGKQDARALCVKINAFNQELYFNVN